MANTGTNDTSIGLQGRPHLAVSFLVDHPINAIEEAALHLHEKTVKQHFTAFNYGTIEGGAEKVGMIANNSQSPEHGKAAQQRKEKEKREQQHWKQMALKALEDAQALADYHFDLWKQAEADLAAIQAELDEVREDIKYLAEAQKRFENECEFELNEYGELKDPKLESLLQDYEKVHGKKVDRSDFDAVYAILFTEIYQDKLQEKENLETQEDLKAEDARTHKENYEKSKNIANDLRNSIENNDGDGYKKAAEQWEELSAKQKYGAIIKIGTGNLNNNEGKKLTATLGLTDEQLEEDSSFSWGSTAPDIQTDFANAVQGNQEPVDPTASSTVKTEVNPSTLSM